MKIYRVEADVNNFQYLMLEDESILLSEMLNFDCTGKADKWETPAVFILKPKLKVGNFPDLFSKAVLVVDEVALDSLRGLLERSGELLPLPHEGKLYHVVNVTGCYNVLDTNRTKWRFEKGRPPIDQYVFHRRRLTQTPLFKIPETCKSEILTCEGIDDPEHEFKGRVEKLGLKGLIFEELWSSES
jgi:hypothetical protein